MKQLGVLSAVATVIAFDIIILLGILGKDDATAFHVTLVALDVALPVSSVLMAWFLMRRGRRTAAMLFASNVVLMALVLALHLAGVVFGRAVLFGVDLYVLNLYLILLALYGPLVLRSPGEERMFSRGGAEDAEKTD